MGTEQQCSTGPTFDTEIKKSLMNDCLKDIKRVRQFCNASIWAPKHPQCNNICHDSNITHRSLKE